MCYYRKKKVVEKVFGIDEPGGFIQLSTVHRLPTFTPGAKLPLISNLRTYPIKKRYEIISKTLQILTKGCRKSFRSNEPIAGKTCT